jgi:cytosine/adenosine deaminase-related metal-dependent hydrolase
MIIRARVVVPMEAEPIENGAVVVSGSEILAVDRFDRIKSEHGGEVVDLGDQVLLPGLINVHCHLDYTNLRGAIPPQPSFTDWIRAINSRKAQMSEADYLSSIGEGFAETQDLGTTSLVNLEALPTLLSRVPRSPLRVWSCAELIDVRQKVAVQEAVNDLKQVQSGGWLGGIGLAPHAPYTASAELYSDAAKICREENILFTTHVAESGEEMEMFRDARGPLFEFLKGIGRPMNDCGGTTPVSVLLRSRAIDERSIIAHLNELTDSDFDLLARGPRFQIAHCPRSHSFFGHAPFALKKLRSLGFNISLGTDSLASNSSLSLFAEMRELLRKESLLSPRAVIAMVTVNAAVALGASKSIGRIAPGLRADLIAVPLPKGAKDLFEGIVSHEGNVGWVMVNGTPIRRP